MNDKISFHCLRQILLDLGFVEKLTPDAHLVFEHGATGTFLFYHHYKNGENLTWLDHVKTRRFLDERGILNGDAFEALLHQTPV